MTGIPGTTTPAIPRTLEEALDLVGGATAPEDLFGPYDGTPEACLRSGGRMYRALARLLHPDTVPDARKGPAQAVFTRLSELWLRYQQTITGVTGRQVVITTRKRAYSVGVERARGDIASLYKVTYADRDGTEARALLKMPRSVADNDLMEREAAALARIERDGDPEYAAYVPRLIEAFRHRDAATGTERRANVVERVRGFVSLTEVREAYPDGLDARDVAWMWRRLLVALGYAHRAGVVHGAVVPDHVLIHPQKHGLVLVDWCYATLRERGADGEFGPAAEHVPALLDRFADLYPPEVPGKATPDASTDIFMATRCMTYLLGPDAPKPLFRFARGCTLPAQARRPHDAWQLLGELDDLLGRLYGPRRFRPFTMPGRRKSTT
ncbi:molecular chaperone DnaJ [Yinghuangia soli]|uniref:Molecular chaperone DnaJ n=1 Tax=Yinghuangia soli TaxID=2908204 RepID=A0AA41PUR3_9ACTN|nr:molecular chaperone DnaJ [Yinghuangia soli]MCF2525680.1 molecular chaperone DnaJ [Yinghuangia soli]